MNKKIKNKLNRINAISIKLGDNTNKNINQENQTIILTDSDDFNNNHDHLY
jgi:hypothetical protein